MATRKRKAPAVAVVAPAPVASTTPRTSAATPEPVWQAAQPTWTPALVRRAYEQAQNGELEMAALLCDGLRSDPRIRGVLETRKNALFGCDLTFEQAGHKGRTGPIGRALDDDGEFWTMAPEPVLSQIFWWGILTNCGLAEKTWIRTDQLAPTKPGEEPSTVILRDKRWIQILTPKHPRNLRFDGLAREWRLRVGDGNEIAIDLDGPQWCMFSPFGDNSPYQHGLYYSLALLWLAKTFSDYDWGRRNEARARSALAGSTPEGATDDDRDAFARDLAALRTKLAIAMPYGYDVKPVEFGAADHETFKKRIDWADAAIGTLVLGMNIAAETGYSKSLSAPKTDDKVRQDYLESDGAGFGTFIQRGVLRSYAAVRFGSAALAPWPRWNTDPPDDLASSALMMVNASKALATLVASGVPIDFAAYCERFQIPIIAGAPLKPPEPKPAPGDDEETDEEETTDDE